jgi:hypothetical protein
VVESPSDTSTLQKTLTFGGGAVAAFSRHLDELCLGQGFEHFLAVGPA